MTMTNSEAIGRLLGRYMTMSMGFVGDEGREELNKENEALDMAIDALRNQELFEDFFVYTTSVAYGKQCYFKERDNVWYSRMSCKFLTLGEALDEGHDYLLSWLDDDGTR